MADARIALSGLALSKNFACVEVSMPGNGGENLTIASLARCFPLIRHAIGGWRSPIPRFVSVPDLSAYT
jgi:hypothetical protein